MDEVKDETIHELEDVLASNDVIITTVFCLQSTIPF